MIIKQFISVVKENVPCLDRCNIDISTLEPNRALFVYEVLFGNVEYCPNKDNTKLYHFEGISKNGSRCMSFKLTVNVPGITALLQPEYWLMCVCMRCFYSLRSRNDVTAG